MPAPPEARVLFAPFGDIGAFILKFVEVPGRLADHWLTVRGDLAQARFGAGRAEAHTASALHLLQKAGSRIRLKGLAFCNAWPDILLPCRVPRCDTAAFEPVGII